MNDNHSEKYVAVQECSGSNSNWVKTATFDRHTTLSEVYQWVNSLNYSEDGIVTKGKLILTISDFDI